MRMRRNKIPELVQRLEEALKEDKESEEISALLNDYLDSVIGNIAKSKDYDYFQSIKFSEYSIARLVLVKYWNCLEWKRDMLAGRYEQMDRYIGAREVASLEKDRNPAPH